MFYKLIIYMFIICISILYIIKLSFVFKNICNLINKLFLIY